AEDRLELAESAVEGELEQVLLARDVVVDRRLGDAEVLGEHAHRGRVVAVPVEHLDRDEEDRLLIVVVPGCLGRHRRIRHELYAFLTRSAGTVRLCPRNSATTPSAFRTSTS